MYQIVIFRSAQKALSHLPDDVYLKVCEKIRHLSLNPRPFGCKKLIARPAWRIRVGDYRVIYEISDRGRTVTIIHVGHRRDVY